MFQGHRCSFHRLIAQGISPASVRDKAQHGCLEYYDWGQLDDLRDRIKAIARAVMSSEEGLAVAEFSETFSSTMGQIIQSLTLNQNLHLNSVFFMHIFLYKAE